MNKLIVLIMLCFVNNIYADDMQNIEQQTITQGAILKNNSFNNLKNFNPKLVFDKYAVNVKQTQYYGGVSQHDANKLKYDAMQDVPSTNAGKLVTNSIKQHPKFIVSNKDEYINHAKIIQSNAKNITHDFVKHDLDCKNSLLCNATYNPNKDFAKSISALSATSAATKQLDQNSMTIFAGHVAKCSEAPVGFSNCCTEKGWGQDAKLAKCSMEAKKLHEARSQNLAIKVGRYCSSSKLIHCLKHYQVFCVFDSKLAKIIQQQGRSGQLNLDFGNAKHPNCIGITPAQLQAINLEKIDFNDFYADIHAIQPDLNLIIQKIKDQVGKI